MNLKLTLAKGCLALSLASMAAADSPTMKFACDTPAGHFSSWSQTLSAAVLEIEGKFKVNELRKDKKWSPAVNVMVRGGADDRTSYGIRIFGLAKSPDMLFAELFKAGAREPIGPLGGILGTDPQHNFKLKLDATGALTVSVAGAESTTQIGAFKLSEVSLSCSTVDVEFTDVRLTTTE